MMTAPNCYQCIHRRSVPGDAHSQCVHPETSGAESPIGFLVAALGGTIPGSDALGIRANPHGVRSGWFMWPVNYDPAWLEACSGFVQPENKQAPAA